MGNIENKVREIISRGDNLYDGYFSSIIVEDVEITSSGQATKALAQPQADSVYADDGNFYNTIGDALNNATSYVSIGPGTFNENLTVTTDDMTIEGVGESTVIDGGDSSPAVTIDARNVTISNLSAITDRPGSQNAIEVTTNGDKAKVYNIAGIVAGESGIYTDGTPFKVTIRDCDIEAVGSGSPSIEMKGNDSLIEGVIDNAGNIAVSGQSSNIVNCRVNTTSNLPAIELDGSFCIASNNQVDTDNGDGILVANGSVRCQVHNNMIFTGAIGIVLNDADCRATENTIIGSGAESINCSGQSAVINGNTISGSQSDGINVGGSDSVIDGNVVRQSSASGIRLTGTDQIATSNRISDSAGNDLNTSGATTPTTANNKTGPLN